jgi:hypothetical protein
MDVHLHRNGRKSEWTQDRNWKRWRRRYLSPHTIMDCYQRSQGCRQRQRCFWTVSANCWQTLDIQTTTSFRNIWSVKTINTTSIDQKLMCPKQFQSVSISWISWQRVIKRHP